MRWLPEIIAGLNATAFVLLVAGFRAIRAGRAQAHRRLMIAAFCVSAVFLAVYLLRAATAPPLRFQGEGWARGLYLFVLLTHMPLAALVVPLSVTALWLALRGRFAKHRRVTRILYPVWAYVSVTGVLVYLMLHHWPGALRAGAGP